MENENSKSSSSKLSTNSSQIDSLTDLQQALEKECFITRKILEKNAEESILSGSWKSEELWSSFDQQALDHQLKDIQRQIFKDPNFLSKTKDTIKQEQKAQEYEIIRQREEEEVKKQTESMEKINAFQFDFGHLDAEVHAILAQLESVYPNVNPMPDTSSTKSMYTSTKENLDRLGLKVILNRLCIIGKYTKFNDETTSESLEDSYEDNIEDEQDKFIDELRRIRLRSDSVFEKELGAVTGCLLSYPEHFVLMLEGPEISILDILQQGNKLFLEQISEGVVFFADGQIMIRYFQHDWLDLKVSPPNKNEIYKQSESEDENKQHLFHLSELCQEVWRNAARAQKECTDPVGSLSYKALPSIEHLEFAINSINMLRELRSWYKKVINLIFGDFTSNTWPHVFYPLRPNACKNDTQFDFLGVIDKYENIPERDQELEDFLNIKPEWKPRTNLENEEFDETKKYYAARRSTYIE